MKKGIKYHLILLGLLTLSIGHFSCEKENTEEDIGQIQGTPGNPRFNLQFTNKDAVDLDIHVITPDGSEIYYSFPTGQKGMLDIDCLCDDCPNGANENVYWVPGTAPSGIYKVWVEYYGSCNDTNSSSNYTLRIMNNSSVISTYTGTLNMPDQKSQVYTFTY